MKKLLFLFLLVSILSAGSTIRLRPNYTLGKMTNGDWYTQVTPIRISWSPLEEWNIGYGWSFGFGSPRGSFSLMGDHLGWAQRVKVQYKPLKFMESIVGANTIQDFAISYEKQVSEYYPGSNLNIGRLNYNDWEEVTVGFDFTF